MAERLKKGLARTRATIETPIDLLRGRRSWSPADLDAVEAVLLAADFGPSAARRAIELLKHNGRAIGDGGRDAMRELLLGEIRRSLECSAVAGDVHACPRVSFFVGVNGTGKTTTIGKLAHVRAKEGHRVLLCAADTFRAAAAEQLEAWAERSGAAFHRGAAGADPSAVLTDALRAARARGHEDVLVDTAGRLHTKGNLMAELSKMARVAAREVSRAPHETLLVLDATVGGNGLVQAREFARALPLTGLVLTKLDGTAKGGVAVAVVEELKVPIQYIGVGEGIDDLLPFEAAAFAENLLWC
ncbi:MAG: signal recognition particle-docking protein FtsY [Vicinamibacteria bacterium]|nr:signal recognition particle-docking protein FtsY [Vicinamibacteria bacterium]